MAKWIRLAGNQYLGFWLLGLVLFAVQEIPYMLMPLFRLETNPIMNMTETSEALDICEKVLGVLCIILMIFVVHNDAKLFSVSDDREKVCFTFALILLLANFAGWALYFTGHQSVFVMMLFIVALPPLYYTAIGLWRHNWPLAVAGMVFFAVHFSHVLGNLKG
ncbi:MAG: hypothetical protein VZR73_17320 [Acutalibacteraceae bacterium]|nr:hypothetical protein [Acutalibacteraceae bacterium]